jgi:hypothetical protein
LFFTKFHLCKEFGKGWEIKHNPSIMRDVETDLKYYESGIRDGWLTVDEIRKCEDLSELKSPSLTPDVVQSEHD